LVEDRYLRDLPRDPFTRSDETWQCISPAADRNGQLPQGGCFDVKSGSDLVGLNDVPYREW
jgi:general secretion pathway protein G